MSYKENKYMKMVKFYLILNIINLILSGYMCGCFILSIKMIDSDNSSTALTGFGIYILFVVSKFVLLPIFFGIINFVFKNSFITLFTENLKTNEHLQDKALINAIVYDALINLCLVICLESSFFGLLIIPFFYELITWGGILIFYVMLIISWKKE